MVWNRTIFVFRSSFEQRSPAQRAAAAKERIEGLPQVGPWTIETRPAMVGPVSGILITVNQEPVSVYWPAISTLRPGKNWSRRPGEPRPSSELSGRRANSSATFLSW